MISIRSVVALVLPVLLTACGADKSPPAAAGPTTTLGALGDGSISTDAPSYSVGATITVTFSGMPGNMNDWIAIAAAGSDNTSYVDYVFTNGQTSGTATFTAPAAGSYVARSFIFNTYTLVAESATFTTAAGTISTDASNYSPGATITVTFSGMPGNQRDWIAIAPAGSDNTNYVDFVFTNGQTSGTATFTAPAAGSYVARSFIFNTYTRLAESSPFTVTAGPSIATDKTSYGVGATISVTFSGLPGNAKDWIAIAAAGSDNTSYVDFVFTNGQTSGTATFTAPAAGSYVARAFSNNTYTLLAESATFTVTAASISTDRLSYAPGDTITVTFAGTPGNQRDWIAIAPAGSDNTSYVDFVFTNGQTSGTATFTAPVAGSYVARSFIFNTYTRLAESPTFTVAPAGTPTISTDRTSYSSSTMLLTVTYAGLPGNAKDWIAIAVAGSDNTSYVDFVFTNGQTSGTASFMVPAVGSYVARAFSNNTFTLLVESAPFTVVAPSISTDQTSYAPGATITVTYTGMPGNDRDWIAIAAAGSDNTSYVDFVFTNGQTNGTATFVVSTPGLYVARSFRFATYSLIAQSPVVTVCGDTGGTLCFVANLTQGQEVPPTGSTATGSGVFVFDPSTRNLTYQVQETVAGATAAHIHENSGGLNGPVIVPFTLVGQGASGSAVLTQTQADDLLAGNLYTNVHSPTFPGGEIRGQIMKPGQILFVANLSQAQEVPPTGSAATGTGSVVFDPATNNIIYRLQHTVANATAAHIHQQVAGMNGPVIVPFTLVGLGASGTATLTASQATAMQNAGCYMNVHSAAFPGGEIRGQLLRP